MVKLGTRLSLRKLLNDEDYLLIWLQAGYTKKDRSRMKFRLRKDQLSQEKIEEVLTTCGFTVAQEKLWQTPS